MHTEILWCGFLGAWLPVAGPLYQAALELDEEEVSRADVPHAVGREEGPPRPSSWWWLVPPVGHVLQRRYARKQREAAMASLPRDVMLGLVSFMNKATAWFYVAAGASLIATKETYELVQYEEWPGWLFWALVVVMLAAAAVYTAVRMSRTHRLVASG